MSIRLQSWWGRFDRRLEGVGTLHFYLARENLFVAGNKECIKLLAAKTQVRAFPVWGGDDAVHSAGLIADLDAHARGDIEPTVAIDAQAIGAAVVGRIWHMQVEILLLVGQRAIGLDLVAVNPMRTAVGHIEQRLVGRERDAVGRT